MKRDFTTFLAAAEQGNSCPRGNPDSVVGYEDRNVHAPFRQASVWTLFLFFCLATNFALAADPVPPKPVAPAATQRELWVPTEHLQSVLKKMPRAVMLTPEQYDLLLRDSQLATADPAVAALAKQKPPVKVTVRETRFSGEITVGGDVVVMTADYVVESFADQWAEIPLVLHRGRLAHIEVDAKSALRVAKPAGDGQIQPLLVVKGRGKHSVRAVYHIPVMRSPTGNSILVPSPGTAAASLILKAPPGAELDSALPFTRKVKPGSEPDGNVPAAVGEVDEYHFVLPAQQNQNFEIRWTARNVAEIPDAAVFQNCQYLYSIDSTRIQADLGFVLNSNLTKLPNRFVITFPEEVRVLSVEGSELLRWTRVAGDAIEIILVPGERDVADLRILAEADVTIPEAGDEETEDATMTLPVANVVGIHRASGTMAIIGSDDVRVKNIATGPLTAPIPDDIEGAIANAPFYVAAFRFPVATVPPTVTLSRIGEKYKAQLDTLIALERESVQLKRTLNVIPDEGRTFEIDFTLPEGEELLDVADGNRADFSWVRGEGNSVQLSWKAGLSVGAGDTLTITSRRDPEGWFALGEEAMPLSFASATIDGAEALSGYVAASFNESFRVETVTSEGLDPRDGRATPVTGTLAWFRLSDYNLTLNASRRSTEIEAAHTAYALPLASTLELEGQVDLAIRYTPIGEIVIEFPPAVAAQARFDSPLIAQKNLDAETGAWTLDFHDELIGPQQIRYRMSLPFEVEEIGKDSDQKRFEISLPVVKIPAAKRLRGEWVMEANTDTELEFVANGLDAVDSLRVPQISGYKPRHRVIAAYRYRGEAWSLKLAGTRHAHAELVSTVIDSLRLDTVVSTDGDDRHQAIMSLRTTGEQFLDIGLPQDAVLWTLKVDGETVKPIRSDPGTLRIQLPAFEDAGDRAISLKLIYETPGREWGGSGKEKLQPIRVADRIPVMQTQWLLHLPEGYDYQKFETNLSEEFEVVDRTLLGVVGDEMGRRLEHLSPFQLIAATANEAGMAWDAETAEKNDSMDQSATMDRDEESVMEIGRQTTEDLMETETEEKKKLLADAKEDNRKQNAVTKRYRVPKNFMQMASRGDKGEDGSFADPFAGPASDPSRPKRPPTAQEVFEQLGVTFPPGGTAEFDPSTGELLVRSSEDQLELAEMALDSVTGSNFSGLNKPSDGPGEETDMISGSKNSPKGAFFIGNSNQTAQFFGQKALDQINPNWRDVPVMNQAPEIKRMFQRDEMVVDNNQKVLGELTINDLDLNGKTVEEALALIREKTLADTGEATPPVGAHSATSRSKLVKFIPVEKADPEPSGVDPALKNKLDLKLSNVTVLEALDQIEEASNTHFRVTSDGILFATKAVSLEPMQTIFMELPESEFRMSDGNGGMQAAHARVVLSEAGIKFPVGSSAAYNPSTGRLAVRNTRPNLEAVASLYAKFLNVESQQAHAAARAEKFEQEFLGGAADLKGFDLADIGRLPIDFALPESGRSYAFSGLYAPEQIEFRFVNWERQIRFAWIWILVGGLAFWFGAYRRLGRPVFLGLLGIVVLTFVPLVISKSLLAFCNALLIGWLVAGVIWVVWRISVKSAAKTEEVAV